VKGIPNTDDAPTEEDLPDLERTPRRLRWRFPGRDLLGAEIDDALTALRSTHNVDAKRVWPWINGRRTPREIHERLAFGGLVSMEALSDCLRLLEQAGVISPD